MDILKHLMSNPGLHRVAETIIGYMDRKVAQNLVGKCELLSEEERKFLMKTLRRRMFNEAQLICDKTNHFVDHQADECENEKSLFQMFPFFIEALQELKTSEDLVSFKLLGKILSLVEDVIDNSDEVYDKEGFKLACLNRCIDPDDQSAKGPKDMLKILRDGADIYDTLCDVLYDMYYC